MLKKAFATTLLGAGLGALMLPGVALAATTVTPGVVQPGGTVTIHVTCSPGSQGHAEVIGPVKTFDVALSQASDGTRGTFSVPAGTASVGTWHVNGMCGGGAAGSTTFTVSPGGTGPATGDGGRNENGAMLGAGAALLAAAGGGFFLLRRRVHA